MRNEELKFKSLRDLFYYKEIRQDFTRNSSFLIGLYFPIFM